MTVRVKPDTADPSLTGQLKTALAARGLSIEETAPATWLVRSTGAPR
jgi:general secretion pathway protein L